MELAISFCIFNLSEKQLAIILKVVQQSIFNRLKAETDGESKNRQKTFVEKTTYKRFFASNCC